MKDHRLEINTLNSFGYTTFHTACGRGFFNIVQLLINDPRVDVNAINENNGTGLQESLRTAFHCACNSGNLKIINLFLSSNINIDLERKDNNNKTGFNFLSHTNIDYNNIKKDKISTNQKLLFSISNNDLETSKTILKKNKTKRII